MSSSNNDEKETIRLDLEGQEAKKLRWVKEKRGFTMNTELVRVLMNEEYTRQGGLPDFGLPRLEHLNYDDNGVKILDRQAPTPDQKVAEIYFKREGIWCNMDHADSCEHITYALTLPAIKKIIRKHIKQDGWNLPNV